MRPVNLFVSAPNTVAPLRVTTMMAKHELPKHNGPDYAAMADAIMKIAADLRASADRNGNLHQLAQAERLEQIAGNIRASID